VGKEPNAHLIEEHVVVLRPEAELMREAVVQEAVAFTET
jgi:hypothetical protein